MARPRKIKGESAYFTVLLASADRDALERLAQSEDRVAADIVRRSIKLYIEAASEV